jgi:hypothetical protein
MEPGARYDINVRVEIDDDIAPGTIMTNCAAVTIDGQDAWPLDDASCVGDRINAHGPNLRVFKEYRWDGESQIRYEVMIENVGTRRLEDVWITDTYPEDTAFNGDWHVGHGPWITLTHDAGNRQLIFWAEEFDPGNTARIVFYVDLDGGVIGEQGLAFTNEVEAPIPGDVYPPDNQGEATAYTGPDLFVEKWLSEGELKPGERITLTVVYGNYTDWPWEMSDDTETRVIERVPDGMTYVAAYWPDGNPNPPDYGGPGLPEIVWDLERLGGDDWRWFDLVVELDDDLAPNQVLLNEIEIEQRPEVDIDPIPENNIWVYPVTIEGSRVYLPMVLKGYKP